MLNLQMTHVLSVSANAERQSAQSRAMLQGIMTILRDITCCMNLQLGLCNLSELEGYIRRSSHSNWAPRLFPRKKFTTIKIPSPEHELLCQNDLATTIHFSQQKAWDIIYVTDGRSHTIWCCLFKPSCLATSKEVFPRIRNWGVLASSLPIYIRWFRLAYVKGHWLLAIVTKISASLRPCLSRDGPRHSERCNFRDFKCFGACSVWQ